MLSAHDIFTANKNSSDMLYSYYYINDNYENKWEKQKAFNNWRYEIANYTQTEDFEVLQLIAKLLKEQDEKVYLEFSYIFTEIRKQVKDETISNKTNPLNRIINCIKGIKEHTYEKICTNSTVHNR